MIFRYKFYDVKKTPIHIPSINEDKFIRKAYYGGHSDVYIPEVDDGYSYDVNSLYPDIMAKQAMPVGKPTWYGNLTSRRLEDLHGFVEAYVVCPLKMKNPLLPFRRKDGTLINPVGRFFGVYYTEELKKAKEVGYMILPIKGYLYEKAEGMFT